MIPEALPPLIVVTGPNASGKSALAIKLALRLDGEIVSADSRQVYRGLDFGTAKVSQEEQRLVRHHVIDVAEPMQLFTLAQYQDLAVRAIHDIHSRQKVPLLVGGTPLYVRSIVDNYLIPRVPPQVDLREQLSARGPQELAKMLSDLDPEAALGIDPRNTRRLVRAIEVTVVTGVPFSQQRRTGSAAFQALSLAINWERPVLYERIDRRVDERLPGMLEEISSLLDGGVSATWLYDLGLEYRFITMYLRREISSCEEAVAKLKFGIHAFTRHQYSWLRRDTRLAWLPGNSNYEEEAFKRIRSFLEGERITDK